jgi:CxxC-x17-CxxC domain-containing protein
VISIMTYADKHLICRHCGSEFLFTAFEQEFYVLNNFTHEIEYCRTCRKARKALSQPVFLRPSQSLPAVVSMRGATSMVCGTTIAASFAPRVDRPIYCAECYEQYGSTYASR